MRLRRVAILVGAAIVLMAALVRVTVTGPAIAVRWAADVSVADRQAREQQYGLRNGRPHEGTTWKYELADRSRDNISALVQDAAADDTSGIDRATFTTERPDVRVGVRQLPFPFGTDAEFQDRSAFFQLQSLWALLCGAGLLWAAGLRDDARRRKVAVVMLLAFGVAAYAFPIAPSLLRMGDANTYTASRGAFENYAGVREIRYEAHLSHAILGRLYDAMGRTPEAPNEAFNLLMRIATAWFLVCAVAVGVVERWSSVVVRYLGLAVLAPASLLYFGYRELGYLSLNVAAFPLVVRGLRTGSLHLEAGSALFGLGAALHGFGLLSLAGSTLAALTVPGRLVDRTRLALRVVAWGAAAYVGWIAVYLIVLKLPVTPGHAESIPWRPWLADQLSAVDGNRINRAIFSAAGGRDVLFTGWVVGAPLLVIAASLWRTYREEVRTALCYAVPSVIFVLVFWPIQGLGVEMDLLVAAFPALYALAWVCAHHERRAAVAAGLLVSAHLAFWRIVLDGRFVNWGVQ